MKIACALAGVLALVAAGAAGAREPAFQYDPALALAVRYALKASAFEGETPVVKPVYVKCYRDAKAFEKPIYVRFGVGSAVSKLITAYYAGGAEVHMRSGSCANARRFSQGIVRWDTAAAFAVLVHEALHRQGIDNERAATCFANDSVRWAGKVFGLTDNRAEQARVLAFRYSARALLPQYRLSRFECLTLISEHDISWWGAVRTPRLEKLFA